MKQKLLLRIILDVILFGSAMTGMLWIIFPVGIICAWYHRRFFEFPLAAFAFDIIYAAPREKYFNFEYIYLAISLIVFIIITILKSRIRKNIWQKDF